MSRYPIVPAPDWLNVFTRDSGHWPRHRARHRDRRRRAARFTRLTEAQRTALTTKEESE